MRFVRILFAAFALAFWSTVALAGDHGRPTTPTVHPQPAPHVDTHRVDTPHHVDATHHAEATQHTDATHANSTSHQTHTDGSRHTSATTTHASTVRHTSTTSTTAHRSSLQSMLPAGMTVRQASQGFRNHGQFVAAVRVSHNLGIPFVALKREMVTNHLSLGQAIHKLRGTTTTSTTTTSTTSTTTGTPATTGTTTTGTTTTTTGTRRE